MRWDANQLSDDIWQRLSRLTGFLIVVVALIGALVFFKPQLEQREVLQREVVELAREYELTRVMADQRQEELAWLRSDLNYLENIARDRLDLQKDGEQVIRVIRER